MINANRLHPQIYHLVIVGFEAGASYYIGIFHIIFLILYFLRLYLRGPTTGSDNPKRLDGKLVVITGEFSHGLL